MLPTRAMVIADPSLTQSVNSAPSDQAPAEPSYNDNFVEDYSEIFERQAEAIQAALTTIREFLRDFNSSTNCGSSDDFRFGPILQARPLAALFSPSEAGVRDRMLVEKVRRMPQKFVRAHEWMAVQPDDHSDAYKALVDTYIRALVALEALLTTLSEHIPEPGSAKKFFNWFGCLCCVSCCGQTAMMQLLPSLGVEGETIFTMGQAIPEALKECRRQREILNSNPDDGRFDRLTCQELSDRFAQMGGQ